jgi:tetratricopeptide (TPR) repeat protein
MLHHLAERIRTAGLIVTYNGKCFDIPLLMSRYVMNRLPEPQAPPHLDLLHVARRLHRARLQHCQLKSLESGVLGFQRGEDIPGAEIPPLYGDYLRTGDCDLLLPVVDHNAWDVMSMAALVGLYGEPEGVLHPEDLVGLATTLKRAGALEQAERIARQALAAGAGPQALMVSGQIAKARGDKDGALADFLALNREIDDARVRLELAKLYEHHLRAPLKALNYVELGTGERPEKAQRRRERLLAKHLKQIEQSRSLRAPAS